MRLSLTENLKLRTRIWLALLLTLAALILAYAPTFQTIPNGSSHPYMVDAGEIQIALNVWGTLHPTGYPLYTLLASLITHLLTALGLDPALAPGMASLVFGFAALSLLYALLLRLTGRPWLSAAAILLLGLTRTFWIHHVIAEIYTFSMLLLVGLLALALWRDLAWPLRRRVWALALLGGIAVFHHRILALTAPALLVAIWPDLWAQQERRRLPVTLLGAIPLGLLGGLQYLYLPLRDGVGGDWVYGAPGTWQGFREVFSGVEYTYLLQEHPAGLGGFFENLGSALSILANELSAPGLIVAVVALAALIVLPNRHRRTALILLLAAIPYVLWVGALYRSVLAEAVLMPTVLCLVLAVALAGDVIFRWSVGTAMLASRHAVSLRTGITILVIAWALLLIPAHGPFVRDLTHDESGLDMIALAESLPRQRDPVFVVPWGADHFPIAFGQRLLGRNTDLTLVDHRANFRALYDAGRPIVTRPVTFFVFIPDFWAEWFGVERVYVYGFTPETVEVRPEPALVPDPPAPLAEVTTGIVLQGVTLSCDAASILLDITWAARETPDRDLSVFVHLIGQDRADVLAQADSEHPAGGFHPTSSWLPGEQVRDLYRLPRLDGAQAVVFGMYERDESGAFVNYGETTLPLDDGAGCR